ncbi:MAG: riboflavin synthase [Chloroflexi bacterium]|nr:riboflavin synthase [Chloroflexota bacterium]
MFTGIIETAGTVLSAIPQERAIRLIVQAPGLEKQVRVGDSLSVNGVCLTIVSAAEARLEFDVVEETLQRSTLGLLQAGSLVNLEHPVSMSSMLGGHLVQGHVDAFGMVLEVQQRGIERWIRIGLPASLLRYVVEKGSIAVEGVSLTVAAVDESSFSVAITPHTAAVTTLGLCAVGSHVNVETDLLARHLEKLAQHYLPGGAPECHSRP